jgi:hypothetical protein
MASLLLQSQIHRLRSPFGKSTKCRMRHAAISLLPFLMLLWVAFPRDSVLMAPIFDFSRLLLLRQTSYAVKMLVSETTERSHRPRFPLTRPRPRPPLPPLPPRPLELRFGPSISNMSFLLSFNVPLENFPTPGAPTPLSLLPSLLFFILAFSKMMPFSFASFRLFSSFSVCFAMIPLL